MRKEASGMKTSRFSEEQVIKALREQELSESPGRCHPKVEFLDISMKSTDSTKKILKFVVKNAEARCRKAV
jgi:hypothetical protein